MVKLADFGVAMKMNSDGANSGPSGGTEDNPDLAGSPYWMAPEIIEMSTPTSACDIWYGSFRMLCLWLLFFIFFWFFVLHLWMES